MKATWSVLVAYADAEARETATAFCDSMVQKFGDQCNFDVSWWEFGLLRQPGAAAEALRRATAADLIVFSSKSGLGLPSHLRTWTEEWVLARNEREGVLVGLTDADSPGRLGSSEPERFLRRMAHCAGMDFLTELPQSIYFPIPESPESCCERANQLTSVLDSILHQSPAPPGVGG